MKDDPLDAYASYSPESIVRLNRQGWINLTLLVAAVAFAAGWIGWKFMVRQESRQLKSANIAWAEGKPELAWERIESIDTGWVDSKGYHSLMAEMLLVQNPLAALEHLDLWLESGDLGELAEQQIIRLKLRAHIQASDWQGLGKLVETIQSEASLPEQDADLLISEAWLAFEQQDLETVKAKTIAALHSNPHHQEALIFRSSLQSVGNQVIERNQASDSLMPIAESESPNAIRALVILLASRLPVNETDWQRAIELLKSNPYFDSHYALQKRESLNALVGLLRDRDPALAYELASRAVQKDGADSTEQLQAIYLAQQVKETEAARTLLDSLAAEGTDTDANRWLLARQALLEGDQSTAIDLALENTEGVEIEQRFLQVLLAAVEAPASPAHADARKRALQSLISQSSLTLQAWLYAANITWDQLPESRPALQEAALAKADSDPIPIAQFFSTKGELETALQVLDAAEEQTRTPSGYALMLNALLGTEQWAKAATLIQESDYLDDPYLRLGGEVLLAFKTKSEAEQTTIWRQALSVSQTLPNAGAKLANLGDLAFEHQSFKKAGEAYEKAAAKVTLEGLPAKSLFRFAKIKGDAGQTESCLQILDVCLKKDPENQGLKLEIARFSLLLNRDILRAKDLLATLDSSLPKTRALLALSHLKTAQPKRAYRELEAFFSAPSQLDNSMRPILYATLIANGENETAETVRAQIETSELLPEERDLLQKYTPVVIEKIVVPPPSESL